MLHSECSLQSLTQPNHTHTTPAWKGSLPRKWCEVAQNFSTGQQAAVIQTREMLKRSLQTHRHSLCISTPDSSHTLFWLLQKLTLSWPEAGHYASLILYHINHVQILPLSSYTDTYIHVVTIRLGTKKAAFFSGYTSLALWLPKDRNSKHRLDTC